MRGGSDAGAGTIIVAMALSKSKKRSELLDVSPNFVVRFTRHGKPYVAKQVEPHIEYELTERYRVL
jgi:hypothetical protein